MAETPPIYKEHGQTYAADTCVPLVQAAKAGQVRHQALVCGHYPGQKLPRGALPGVKTVGFWDADHPQDWGLDWHRNEGIELTFLETGRLAYSVDGQDLIAQARRPDDRPPLAAPPRGQSARRRRATALADSRRGRPPAASGMEMAAVAGAFGGRSARN